MASNNVSKARSEAARANGSRSRGPVTDAGKQASAQNAITHGLLSTRISPRRQSLYYPVYRRILKALIDTYDPQSNTDRLAVEMLAVEYVHLARAFEMLEAMMTPPVKDEEVEAGKRYRKSKRELRPLVGAVRFLDGESESALMTSDARRAAAWVVERAKTLQHNELDIRSFRAGRAAYRLALDDGSTPAAGSSGLNEFDEIMRQQEKHAAQLGEEEEPDPTIRAGRAALAAAIRALEGELNRDEIAQLLSESDIEIECEDEDDDAEDASDLERYASLLFKKGAYSLAYGDYDSADRVRHDDELALWQAVGAELKSLTDPELVADVLRGSQPLAPKKRKYWVALLIAIRDARLSGSETGRLVQVRLESQERGVLSGIVNDPNQFQSMVLLRRYVGMIENSIERSLRAINARAGVARGPSPTDFLQRLL